MLSRIWRMHRNERGAISVLVLLTIWCLVALLAMTWNTAEYGARKEHLQTTADSAAQSAAVETTRATNAAAGQNMVICQDAAAQTIWEATINSDRSIKRELYDEMSQARRELAGYRMNRNMLLRQLDRTIADQALVDSALATLSSDATANKITDPNFLKQIRQAQSALNWVEQTYMNGAPGGAGRPGPPGPNGEGLIALARNPNNQQPIDAKVLNLIINYILTTELPIIQGPDGAALPNGQSLESRTGPATGQALDSIAQDHEHQVFQSEEDVLAATPDTIEEQSAQLARFYKADVTLATLRNQEPQGPARVSPPIVPAAAVEAYPQYTDSIRAAYPSQASAANLPLTFDIDPINPQTGYARVWHPNMPFSVGSLGTFNLNCNVPDGWGHVWAMPVERYYTDRVSSDQHTIRDTYMRYLDNSRNNRPTDPRDLAYQIRQMINQNQTNNIAPLPRSLPDDQPNAGGGIDRIRVLPRITAPATAPAKVRTDADLFNQHAGRYTQDIANLRNSLMGEAGDYSQYTRSFAVNTWNSAIAQARDDVLHQLGGDKTFMVLASYKFRFIPQELRPALRDSAVAAIEDQIVTQNIQPITQQVMRRMMQQQMGGRGGRGGGGGPGFNFGNIGQVTSQALAAMRPVAHNAAVEIAAEWINRPWPYEITPPTDPVPPWRGMGKLDRQHYFTIIAAARANQDSSPRFVLQKIFGQPAPLVTYAQAEAFNWMEFNTAWGGSERFDQVNWIPYNQGFGGIPVPRCWRLSTIGGWNWEPRLSVTDALAPALENNPELKEYLGDSGITSGDAADFDAVSLH